MQLQQTLHNELDLADPNSKENAQKMKQILTEQVEMKIHEIFSQVDVNNDGKISQAEFFWAMTGADVNQMKHGGNGNNNNNNNKSRPSMQGRSRSDTLTTQRKDPGAGGVLNTVINGDGIATGTTKKQGGFLGESNRLRTMLPSLHRVNTTGGMTTDNDTAVTGPLPPTHGSIETMGMSTRWAPQRQNSLNPNAAGLPPSRGNSRTFGLMNNEVGDEHENELGIDDRYYRRARDSPASPLSGVSSPIPSSSNNNNSMVFPMGHSSSSSKLLFPKPTVSLYEITTNFCELFLTFVFYFV